MMCLSTTPARGCKNFHFEADHFKNSQLLQLQIGSIQHALPVMPLGKKFEFELFNNGLSLTGAQFAISGTQHYIAT
jgi:hypothetical protein